MLGERTAGAAGPARALPDAKRRSSSSGWRPQWWPTWPSWQAQTPGVRRAARTALRASSSSLSPSTRSSEGRWPIPPPESPDLHPAQVADLAVRNSPFPGRTSRPPWSQIRWRAAGEPAALRI